MIKIKDLTFSQYFTILEVLNKDQYPFFENKKGKKVQSHQPLPKNERTEDFMFELHRAIVKEMCGLGKEFIQDDTFVLICWDLISQKLSEINELVSYEGIEDIVETFDFEGVKLGYTDFKNWTFNKWVTLENALKGVTKRLQNGDIEIIEHGAKFLLPICFGDWADNMPDFEKKYDYFNNQLFAKDVALVFAKVNNLVNALKNAHKPMYSSEPIEGGGSAYKSHVEMFGWQETLKNLAEKRVFGDYLQLKQAPLLEVLEYLNCSVSAEMAKQSDFEKLNPRG